LQNLCRDLKDFALQYELLEKNTLKDDEWMPHMQKQNSSRAENNSWQNLFKHMGNALHDEKARRDQTMEWIKSNVVINKNEENKKKNNNDENNDFVDCVMQAMKSMKNDQMQLQAANSRIQKEKQEMTNELKDMKSTLSKEAQNKTENKEQLQEMESEMTILRREKQEINNTLSEMKQELDQSKEKNE